MKFKCLLLISIVSLFISCSSKPPKDLKAQRILDQIYVAIIETNLIKNDDDKLKTYMEESEKKETLSVLYSDETIVFKDEKRNFTPFALIYSNGNGQTYVNRDLYVSRHKKKNYLYSFDNKVWFSQNNNMKNDIKNIDFLYKADPLYSEDNKTLTINYSWEVIKHDEAVPLNIGSREIIHLKDNLIFAHEDKKMININFDKESLFIPKGTVVHSQFLIEGNLLNSKIDDSGLIISSKKDLYLYRAKNKLGLSFDNENWNISIFSFTFKSENYWFAQSYNGIMMENHLNLIYKE